jgi:O-antigen ligase
MKSLEYTFSHPVFGIGAGTFSAFEGGMSRLDGRHGQWQETHNSYTQISSEVGLPAVICFIGGIISALFLLSRTMSKAQHDKLPIILVSAFCCMLAIAMLGTCMLFLSLGYRFYMPALTGLAIALERVLRMDPPVKAAAPVAAPSIARLPTQRLNQRPFVRENYYSGK